MHTVQPLSSRSRARAQATSRHRTPSSEPAATAGSRATRSSEPSPRKGGGPWCRDVTQRIGLTAVLKSMDDSLIETRAELPRSMVKLNEGTGLARSPIQTSQLFVASGGAATGAV